MLPSIIISGLPAVGKTTVARALAEEFGLEQHSGGDVLKEMAVTKGYTASGIDWWDTRQGIKFLAERKRNPSFDKEVDTKLAELARQGNAVITSYPLPWLVQDAIKFWLKGSRENRARRMAGRDNLPYDQAMEIVTMRDEDNRTLYHNLYSIRFGEDLSVFDYVINTDQLSLEGVKEVAVTIVRNLQNH